MACYVYLGPDQGSSMARSAQGKGWIAWSFARLARDRRLSPLGLVERDWYIESPRFDMIRLLYIPTSTLIGSMHYNVQILSTHLKSVLPDLQVRHELHPGALTTINTPTPDVLPQ